MNIAYMNEIKLSNNRLIAVYKNMNISKLN